MLTLKQTIALVGLTLSFSSNAAVIGQYTGFSRGESGRGDYDELILSLNWTSSYSDRLFNVSITDGDQGKTFGFTEGADFDIANSWLTNGIDDERVIAQVSNLYGAGGRILSESNLFSGFDPLRNYRIDSIDFTIDALRFFTSSRGNAAHSINYTITLQGAEVPVPAPAAIWLFGSALAGLGWMRRRKTT